VGKVVALTGAPPVTLADLARELGRPADVPWDDFVSYRTPLKRKDSMEPLLTVREAAQLLRCSEAAVRKWLVQRRLPIVKLGELTRIPSYALNVAAEHGLPAPGTYPRPKDPRGKALRQVLTC